MRDPAHNAIKTVLLQMWINAVFQLSMSLSFQLVSQLMYPRHEDKKQRRILVSSFFLLGIGSAIALGLGLTKVRRKT